MDGTESETTKVNNDVADTSLPAVMASLEMLTVNTNLSPSENKKANRRRISQIDSNEILNRRCSLRPRKRTCSEMENDDNIETEGAKGEVDVKDYYLNKSLKKRLNNLETIYEEKDDTGDSTMYMSVKRYKRMIQFDAKPSGSKLKKRRTKIKKVFGSKINFKRRCASMQILLDKLNSIRAESPAKIESEVK